MEDISDLLRSWEYNPNSNIRKIVGNDEREKIQIRVINGPFAGILQMELDGRPDNKRPHNYDFALDYYKDSLRRYTERHGTDAGFSLDEKACEELFDESGRVYGRYAFLAGIEEHERVVRDTERNMELFRFVNKYASSEENKMNLERWWPYIIRINGMTRAFIALDEGKYESALKIIQETKDRVNALPEINVEEFYLERDMSKKILTKLERAIKKRKPKTKLEKLKAELEKAVIEEDFEKAAELRDRIKDLEKRLKSS